jgi:hypothetical protein
MPQATMTLASSAAEILLNSCAPDKSNIMSDRDNGNSSAAIAQFENNNN